MTEEKNEKMDEHKDESEKENSRLKELESELEQLKDKYIRLLAEFENYRKRQEKLQRESFESFADVLLCGLLDILDNFEYALATPSTDDSFRRGIELIYKKMKDFLASYGVEELACKGEKFDPLMHEALSVCETDDGEDGVVVDVLQKGYKRGCRLIRAPKVVVGMRKKVEGEKGEEK